MKEAKNHHQMFVWSAGAVLFNVVTLLAACIFGWVVTNVVEPDPPGSFLEGLGPVLKGIMATLVTYGLAWLVMNALLIVAIVFAFKALRESSSTGSRIFTWLFLITIIGGWLANGVLAILIHGPLWEVMRTFTLGAEPTFLCVLIELARPLFGMIFALIAFVNERSARASGMCRGPVPATAVAPH